MKESGKDSRKTLHVKCRGNKDTVSDFCSNSSAPGLSKIVQPQSLYLKAFWYIRVLCTAVSLVIHLCFIADSYFQYETIQQTQIKYEVPSYPDITICDNEPYTKKGREIAQRTMNKFVQYRLNLSKSLNNGKDVNRTLYQLTTVAAEVANLGIKSAMQSGHSIHNIVVHCMFVSKKCTDILRETRLVQTYFNPFFLNCFTVKGSVLENVNVQTGILGSLSLILHSEYSESNNTLYRKGFGENQIGKRITIHEQGTLPDIATFGFDIEPGKSTSIAISTERRVSLPWPYSSCVDGRKAIYKKFIYTNPVCIMHCMQDEIINQCNCKSSAVVVYGEEVREKEFCLKYEPNITAYHQRIECDMHVTERIRRNSSRYCPNCPKRCEHLHYDVTKSTATWPQPQTVFDFIQTYSS